MSCNDVRDRRYEEEFEEYNVNEYLVLIKQ